MIGKNRLCVGPQFSYLISSLLVMFSLPGWSATDLDGVRSNDLIDLSLEELLQIEVTTVLKRPQALSQTPAAVFVITQQDIERSGAQTIPDVLRMAPGIEVAQVDASTWAVTTDVKGSQ